MMGPTAGLHQQASGRCLSENVLTGQTEFQQEVCHTRRGMAMSIPGPHGRTRQVSANAAKESAPPGRGRQGMPARVLSRYTAKKRAVIPAAPPRVKTRAPHGGPVQMTERNRSTDAFKVGGLRRSEK